MKWVRRASAAAGRSRTAAIAGSRRKAVGFSRKLHNCARSLRNRNNKNRRATMDQMEDDMVYHSWMESDLDKRCGRNNKRVSYKQVKNLIERKLAHQKRGFISREDARDIADRIKDDRREEELDEVTIDQEVRRFSSKMAKYNTPPVGNMTEDKAKGRTRIMFCQLNNMSTKAIRKQKIRALNYLAEKYDVDVRMFNEHGCNMDNTGKGVDFPSWIKHGQECRCIVAYNQNDECSRGLYQPGGTGIYVSGETTQYVKKLGVDPRNLGRWSSVVMYAHPNHRCRLVTAYNLPDTKPRGLMTNYQQIKRYCQNNGVNMSPRELFYHDFARQCRVWRRSGETVCVVMDANEHARDGKLAAMLAQEGVEFREFSHVFWGDKPPNSRVEGTHPVTAGFCTKNLEVTQLLQLPHISSVGDHRTWIFEVSTRSMLGCNLLRIQHTVGRRLVMSNFSAAQEYNSLVLKGYKDQCIEERIDEVVSLLKKVGRPVPR